MSDTSWMNPNELQPASGAGHNSVESGALQAFIDRIADRERDKRAAAEDIKDICSEAKSHGYNPKVIKRKVRDLMMTESEKAKRDEEDDLYELYTRALRA